MSVGFEPPCPVRGDPSLFRLRIGQGYLLVERLFDTLAGTTDHLCEATE